MRRIASSGRRQQARRGGEAAKIGTAADKLEARAELSKFNGRRQQNACMRRRKQIAAASLGEIALRDTWFLSVISARHYLVFYRDEMVVS